MTLDPNEILFTAQSLDEPETITFQDAMQLLECGTVVYEHGIMDWGSNYTFLIDIVYHDRKILGIYKPEIGERPLWDFPGGSLHKREYAAFLTSEALGWRIIPPTIIRDGTRGAGSVQLFINHDPGQHYFTFDLEDTSIIDQLKQFAVFDIITNNADRKGGHCLLDENGKIWGIDQGLTFHTHHKLRTVIWDFAGQQIDETILQDMESLCNQLYDMNDPYTTAINDLFYAKEVQSFQNRIERLIATKTYTMPGAGPNQPWPPV